MTNEEKVHYWIDLSDYDRDSIEAMWRGGRYLYVGFVCHQTIEKIFKAYYTKLRKDSPPLVHRLMYLAEQGGFCDTLSEEQKNFVRELDPLNIEARYPEYKERLLKRLTPAYCTELITKTKALQLWIKEKL
ncbi:DNA-binding protein [Bacteroidia bacterium]|nr:DNA-binding protein [Bacteroidia bacterium]